VPPVTAASSATPSPVQASTGPFGVTSTEWAVAQVPVASAGSVKVPEQPAVSVTLQL
jgi:hypothetical protein